MKKYSVQEKAEIAVGAVRSYLRKANVDFKDMSWKDAWNVLDELHRKDPELVASQFYISCEKEYKFKLFSAQWNKGVRK